MNIKAALRKDVSNLVECKIKECLPIDVFLSGTMANQGFYRIECNLIDGRIQAKSVNGPKRLSLHASQTVYRKKRLVENIDGQECDLSMFGQTINCTVKEPNKEQATSSRLIDILPDDNSIDTISLIF